MRSANAKGVWGAVHGAERADALRSGRSVWAFFMCGRLAGVGVPAVGGWILFDFLGSPSRPNFETFQWVTRIFMGANFLLPFPPGPGPTGIGRQGFGQACAEARDCSWRKLILASDFLQGIVALTVPSRPLITDLRRLEHLERDGLDLIDARGPARFELRVV